MQVSGWPLFDWKRGFLLSCDLGTRYHIVEPLGGGHSLLDITN